MSFEITLNFLEAVKENNNTTWLHTYRDLYQQERQRFSDFIQNVLDQIIPLNIAFEELTPKDCIFRFNKDIRFSKDKHPYKEFFAAVIAEGWRKSQLPCIYIHIQPGGKSTIAWWLYLPPRDIAHKTRNNIATHFKEWNAIISTPIFKKTFGKVLWKDLVKMPRGYDKENKAAEWFLYKSRYVEHRLSDKEVCSKDLVKKIIDIYKILQPYNDFLNKAL